MRGTCISLLAAAALSMLSLIAVAQDTAAVAVQLEPRHRPVLTNARVRVLDIRIPAGDKSLMHTHEHDAVHITVQGARIRETKPRGWWVSMHDASADGLTYFSALRGTPCTHAIENIGERATRIVAIELLESASAGHEAAALDGAVAIADNPRVRVDRLEAAVTPQLPALRAQALSVTPGPSQVDGQNLAPGSALWTEPGQARLLESGQFILVQLK